MLLNIFGLEKEKLHRVEEQKNIEMSLEHLLKIELSGNCWINNSYQKSVNRL